MKVYDCSAWRSLGIRTIEGEPIELPGGSLGFYAVEGDGRRVILPEKWHETLDGARVAVLADIAAMRASLAERRAFVEEEDAGLAAFEDSVRAGFMPRPTPGPAPGP